MPKRSIRSLESELASLKARNKALDRKRALKDQIFRERYKGPIRGIKAISSGLSRAGRSVEYFAGNINSKPIKKGKNKGLYDNYDLGFGTRL